MEWGPRHADPREHLGHPKPVLGERQASSCPAMKVPQFVVRRRRFYVALRIGGEV
jgi:hypothetical protein